AEGRHVRQHASVDLARLAFAFERIQPALRKLGEGAKDSVGGFTRQRAYVPPELTRRGQDVDRGSTFDTVDAEGGVRWNATLGAIARSRRLLAREMGEMPDQFRCEHHGAHALMSETRMSFDAPDTGEQCADALVFVGDTHA